MNKMINNKLENQQDSNNNNNQKKRKILRRQNNNSHLTMKNNVFKFIIYSIKNRKLT